MHKEGVNEAQGHTARREENTALSSEVTDKGDDNSRESEGPLGEEQD